MPGEADHHGSAGQSAAGRQHGAVDQSRRRPPRWPTCRRTSSSSAGRASASTTASATLALFARPVSAGMLAQAMGHPEPDVSWALEQSRAAGVIVRTCDDDEPEGAANAATYEPAHPLLGAGALAALGKTRLDVARTRIAYTIADRQSPETAAWTPAEVASLLVAAGDVGDRAQDLCLRAALWCEAAEQFDDAIRFASYALRHTHRCPERVRLLRVLGRTLIRRPRRGRRRPARGGDLRGSASLPPALRAGDRGVRAGRRTRQRLWPRASRAAARRTGTMPGHETATEAGLRALLAEVAYALGTGDRNAFAECRTLASRALRLIGESPCTPAEKAPVRSLAVNFHLSPHSWDTVRAVVESTRSVDALRTRVLGLPAATALCLATGDAADLAALEDEFAALSGSSVSRRTQRLRPPAGRTRAARRAVGQPREPATAAAAAVDSAQPPDRGADHSRLHRAVARPDRQTAAAAARAPATRPPAPAPATRRSGGFGEARHGRAGRLGLDITRSREVGCTAGRRPAATR